MDASFKYIPVHVVAQIRSTGCAKVVTGHFEMHLLLYPNKEGDEGHNVLIHDIVVGSAKVANGHTYTHYEFVVLLA